MTLVVLPHELKLEIKVLEKEIENRLKRKLKGHALVLKFVSPGTLGVPDRIVIHNGNVLFVELKAPGKQLRPAQQAVKRLMESHGASVAVIDSYEAVDELVEALRGSESANGLYG